MLPLVEVEMEPGDALFFHSNVLHRSDQNQSDHKRWAFLIAYNRASNDPVIVHHHPQYTNKLDIVRNCHNRLVMAASLNGGYVVGCYPWVPDSAIMEYTPVADAFKGKDFLDPDNDKTARGVKDK